MEGKCNKAPNSGSSNTPNSKYMDHVYCHTSQPTKSAYSNNMTTAGGGGGSASSPNSDVLALLKENKQLKGMLILHLDLIQEQSDQLMAKDKALITQNEELETLRSRNAALENHVQELQKQLQRQIKRSGEISTLPPPPLAKIQCKANVATSVPAAPAQPSSTNIIQKSGGGPKGISNIIGECNGKFISKIVLQRVPLLRGKRNHSPQSQTTDSEHEEDDEEEQYDEVEIDNEEEIIEEEEEEADEETHSIHDQEEREENEEEHTQDGDESGANQSQEAAAQNSHSQVHVIDDSYDTGNSTEDSNEVLAVQSKRLRLKQAAKQSLAIPRGAKPSVSPASTTTNDGQTSFKAVASTNTSTSHLSVPNQPILSRGKQMTIMRWHAPDYHTDESVSCDSTAETEKRSTTSVTSCTPPKPSASINDKKRYHNSHDAQHLHPRPKIRKCAYISTPQLYSTREWEDEAFNCDYDFEGLKAESKILQSDSPKLEIPKWTEHELSPSYCIEGTEDLSDDIFFKRHAKLEVDEKRRKKWDVQQIREQRRIERLKRRHCKDEVQHAQETASLHSFYPTTENLQTIVFVQDLPVQAFGEMIPRLALGPDCERKDFLLPWLDKVQLQITADNNKKPTVSVLNFSQETNTSSQAQQQMLNSSFVILKKRKRQQSSSFGTSHHHTSRQRSLMAKMASAAVATAPPVPTPITTTTLSPSCAGITSTSTPVLSISTTTTTSCSNLNKGT